MTSISDIIRVVLEDQPFLQEALYLGLINLSALASYLQPAIENKLNKEIKKTSISMALRRYKDKLSNLPIHKIVIDKSSELSSRTNLTLYTIKRSTSLLAKINSFYNYLNLDEGDIFTVIHGTINMSVLTNKRLETVFERLIKGEEVIEKNENVGAIFLLIPPKYIKTPGFFYIISREIAIHNINLLGIANILSEVLLILNEEYVPKAFELLLKLIDR